MEFNRKLISCFSILILLCFLCLLLTLYWSFNVIPLLVFVNSKSSSLPSYSSDLVNDENHDFNNLHDNDNVELDMNLIELEIASRVQRVKQLCKKFHLGKFKWSNNSNDLNLKEPPTALFSYFFWNRLDYLKMKDQIFIYIFIMMFRRKEFKMQINYCLRF